MDILPNGGANIDNNKISQIDRTQLDSEDALSQDETQRDSKDTKVEEEFGIGQSREDNGKVIMTMIQREMSEIHQRQKLFLKDGAQVDPNNILLLDGVHPHPKDRVQMNSKHSLQQERDQVDSEYILH